MLAMFKKKGLGYWLCTAAAVIAFVLAIVVFATWDNALPNVVRDGYIIGIVLLIGVALQVVFTFFNIRFAAVFPVIVYTASIGVIAMRIADTVADQINQVHYQGGDFATCVVYAVLAVVCAILAVVACFLSQNKEEKYLI